MPFTEDQIDQLKNTLDPKHVKKRQGFDYIEAWHASDQANAIFGFSSWDRETVTMNMVQKEEVDSKWRVSYTAQVRITVRADGETVIKEGTGFGQGINKDLGMAHEGAVKEAESDAMKRALTQFGNRFGLALYDKEKTNVAPPKASKANSRELYSELQSGLRNSASSKAELIAWGKAEADRINTLPKDWADQIRDEYCKELEGFNALANQEKELEMLSV